MPIVTSRFRPPLLLCNGHLQTILPVLLPQKFAVTYERERFELEDGDFLDLNWVRGGNVTLKYLGEQIPHPSIIAAVAISVPVDLRASAFALDHRWGNRIYLNRFIKSLVAKVEKKAISFPDQFDVREIRSVRTFRQFDDRHTAPTHGFRDAADYWRQSSSLQYLRWISVPTLLLNAGDDPFLTRESFPYSDAGESANLFLETPESGGHVGFIDFANGFERWCEQRIVEFLRKGSSR